MDQILFPGHDVFRHYKDSHRVGYSFLIHYPAQFISGTEMGLEMIH